MNEQIQSLSSSVTWKDHFTLSFDICETLDNKGLCRKLLRWSNVVALNVFVLIKGYVKGRKLGHLEGK